MKHFLPSFGIAALFLTACAGLELQSEFLAGRQAFLRGEPDNALSYFERVARSNPGFVTNSVLPPRSIWTYIGRARYNSGKFDEARQAFERALSHLKDDHIARLYLGLTRVRRTPSTPSPNALNLQEVTYALREGVEPKRVATLASQRGVAFELTTETENQLRGAGADSGLIRELRRLGASSGKPESPPETRRAQGRKDLTNALLGLRNWLDDFIRNAPEGRFWDPSQEIRKQIERGLAQLSAQPPDWDKAISTAEEIGYQLEEESDRARRDEIIERQRELRR